MFFFEKLKNIFRIAKENSNNLDNNLTNSDIKTVGKRVKLHDKEILNSLNYNILIKERECVSVAGIVFEEYKSYKYLEEMALDYKIIDEYIEFYIDKYGKIKQLINNLLVYLQSENVKKIMYDYRKYSVYANIYEIMLKEKQKIKKFDFIKFFSDFDWVRFCSKYRDTSIKIDLSNNNYIVTKYRILEKTEKYILGESKGEVIKIELENKKIFFGIKIK